MSGKRPLVIVDVGNTLVKLGVFDPASTDPLPHPTHILSLARDWQSA